MPAKSAPHVVNLLQFRTQRERQRLPLFDRQDASSRLLSLSPSRFRPAPDRQIGHRRRMLHYMTTVAKA